MNAFLLLLKTPLVKTLLIKISLLVARAVADHSETDYDDKAVDVLEKAVKYL